MTTFQHGCQHSEFVSLNTEFRGGQMSGFLKSTGKMEIISFQSGFILRYLEGSGKVIQGDSHDNAGL